MWSVPGSALSPVDLSEKKKKAPVDQSKLCIKPTAVRERNLDRVFLGLRT